MRTATLHRTEFGDDGTFGVFLAENGWGCRTGELPWRENQPNLSCIPVGTYLCTYRFSAKHGMCYHVEGVEGRDFIEIHPANYMGDVDKLFRSELLGCIAPGLATKVIGRQKSLLDSARALKTLEETMRREPFSLTIFS